MNLIRKICYLVFALFSTALFAATGNASSNILMSSIPMSPLMHLAPISARMPSMPIPPLRSMTSGVIRYHLELGLTEPQDSLPLENDRYTDLLMSNFIAGVMYGHLIQEGFPGMQFNKDYLYGSIFGQLLQENLSTDLYDPKEDVIDPSASQAAVMGVGQGGPYQINNYAADMVSGGYEPAGFSLINFVALQKNIGYTMKDAAAQHTKTTPLSFNNKYYGPMLPAFFHYLDMVALHTIGKGSNSWVPPWQPDYDNALERFRGLPNNFLDVLLNVAYNQGYYGDLVQYYSKLGQAATKQTVEQVDDYRHNPAVWGVDDGYRQYPYQVRYYLDQLYGNKLDSLEEPVNVVFSVNVLGTVFSNVFQTLSYLDAAGQGQLISLAQTQEAFSWALQNNKAQHIQTLNLSHVDDRATIFNILNDAISRLEDKLNFKFNTITHSQI